MDRTPFDEHPSLVTIVPAPPPSYENKLEDRISAALLGGAIGDALGWVTEFLRTPQQLYGRYKARHVADFISWEKKTGGRFNPYVDYVGAGEYSDDTQLTLCVARSIQPNGRVDNDYFSKVEMVSWLDYARGAGATITAAAKALKRKRAKWNTNFFAFQRGRKAFDYRESGANGVAMRIGPIAMASPHDPHLVSHEVWRNGIVTHGHSRAIVGALVHGHAVALVITERKLEESSWFIDRIANFVTNISFPASDPDMAKWREEWDRGSKVPFEEMLQRTNLEMVKAIEIVRNFNSVDLKDVYARLGCFAAETKGSAIATTAAAIATALRHHGDFETGVLEAVNMIGSDTDTIAGLVAALLGGSLGYAAIPERWTERMQDFSYFLRVGTALARIAERKAEGPAFRKGSFRVKDGSIVSVSALAGSFNLSRNMRAYHPIFGAGTVTDFNVQPLPSKKGGSLLFVTVLFDSGQSCKFKFFRSERRPQRSGQTHLI